MRFLLLIGSIIFIIGGCSEAYTSLKEGKPQKVKYEEIRDKKPPKSQLIIEKAEYSVAKTWFSYTKAGNEVRTVYVALAEGKNNKINYILESKEPKLCQAVENVQSAGKDPKKQIMSLLKYSQAVQSYAPLKCATGDWSDVDSAVKDKIKADRSVNKDVVFLIHNKKLSFTSGAIQFAIALVVFLGVLSTFKTKKPPHAEY